MTNNFENIISRVSGYYSEKVKHWGATPKGVDWRDLESQTLRYKQLLKICDLSNHFSINDIGCGFGFLCDYLLSHDCGFTYWGSDVSSDMTRLAKDRLRDHQNCHFVGSNDELPTLDYSVASGIFNVKMNFDFSNWEQYVISTLLKMDQVSSKGFSFNMLTKYSDREKMREDLYYPDPCFYFDFCKKNFSKQVALLHDYGLYEFTILVRK